MNQNTTRLDPMNNVMHYELLSVAHSLMARGQNQAYWEAVPVPKRPVGQVRFEVARQVSTFAVPVLMLALAGLVYSLKGFLLALPVAWFVGFVLDKLLANAIKRKCRRDEEIDAGRFRAVKFLAEQMGMQPSEVTLPVIYKMAADFRQVDPLVKAAKAKAEAERKEAIARSVRRRPSKGSTGADTAAGTAADTYVSQDNDLNFDYLGSFNPTTGLPMMQGSTFDVAGNQYGTGHL